MKVSIARIVPVIGLSPAKKKAPTHTPTNREVTTSLKISARAMAIRGGRRLIHPGSTRASNVAIGLSQPPMMESGKSSALSTVRPSNSNRPLSPMFTFRRAMILPVAVRIRSPPIACLIVASTARSNPAPLNTTAGPSTWAGTLSGGRPGVPSCALAVAATASIMLTRAGSERRIMRLLENGFPAPRARTGSRRCSR